MRHGDPWRAMIAAVAIASLSLCQVALASDFGIDVMGNRFIEADTIRSYFKQPDARFDADSLDRALKALYATGLFQDVTISRRGDRIIVKVIEHRIIKRVAFEGNNKIKDEQLKQETQSKERGPLARGIVQREV